MENSISFSEVYYFSIEHIRAFPDKITFTF